MYAPQDNQINAWIAAHLGDPAGGIATLRVGNIEALLAQTPGAISRDVHVHGIVASGTPCERTPLPSPRK